MIPITISPKDFKSQLLEDKSHLDAVAIADDVAAHAAKVVGLVASASAQYVIQSGDTYENIAQVLQKITIQMLEDANPDHPPNGFQSDSQINIPF